MYKILSLLIITGIIVIFSSGTAQAETTATIDKSQTAKGIVIIKLKDQSQTVIKAQVIKDKETYTYTLKKSVSNLPLQMGTGDYTIMVMENITGDKYKPLVSEAINVAKLDENDVYTASIPIIEYSVSVDALPAFAKLTEGKEKATDKINTVYDNIVKNYSYDYDKAKNIKSDYVPVLDDVYTAKKGVCYDYASLLGGVLRSYGIPTRLVMGYRPDVNGYHAWNEIKIDDVWVPVDTTYDAQVIKAGKKATMKKDNKNVTIVKVY